MNDSISKFAHVSLYPEAVKLSRGEPCEPRMAILHPTNRCEQKCAGCEYGNCHGRDAAEIPGDRLIELIPEAYQLGVLAALISGGGEPLLHPQIATALEKAKDLGMLVGIFTNGQALDEDLAAVIADSANFIRVSLDAATAETYSRVRGVPERVWSEVWQRIGLLQTAGQRSGLEISAKYLVRASTIEEIPEFFGVALDHGVSDIHFKPLRSGEDEPLGDQLRRAQQLIEQSKARYPQARVHGGMSISHPTMPCWISPFRVVINAFGDVCLCNYWNHRRDTHCFGNILHRPLSEVWFSEEHRAALASIDQVGCDRFDCRFHGLNSKMSELVNDCRPSLDFV